MSDTARSLAKFFVAMRELATDGRRCEGYMTYFIIHSREAGLIETRQNPDAFDRYVAVHILTEAGHAAANLAKGPALTQDDRRDEGK